MGIAPVTPPGQTAPAEGHNFDRLYADSKKIEGEILEFATRLQAGPLDPAQSARLNQVLSATRNAVHASKFMKDIRADLQQMQDASHPALAHYHEHFRSLAITFYGACYQLRSSPGDTVDFESLANALQIARKLHDQLHQQIYSDIRGQQIDETAISSLLNANREMFGANRSLLLAIGDYYLDGDQARDLRGLPEHG
jgi:phosphate:Na+ symporter